MQIWFTLMKLLKWFQQPFCSYKYNYHLWLTTTKKNCKNQLFLWLLQSSFYNFFQVIAILCIIPGTFWEKNIWRNVSGNKLITRLRSSVQCLTPLKDLQNLFIEAWLSFHYYQLIQPPLSTLPTSHQPARIIFNQVNTMKLARA